MGLMCYICQRKVSKSDRISLHKFPNNPILRNEWVKACDLSLFDDLTNIRICSVHFNVHDLDRGNNIQARCTLKANVVPSIDVLIKSSSVNKDIDTVKNVTENNVNTEVDMTNTYENVNEFEEIFLTTNTFDHVINDVRTCQELELLTHAFDTDNESPIQQCDDTVESEVDENFANSGESCTLPKRRVFDPRYVSEIRTTDFGSPKRTQRTLNLVQNTDKKKSKLIKSLQDRNRKLEKRISSLKEIIAHLKKKSTVSNSTRGTLLNSVNTFDHSYATKQCI